MIRTALQRSTPLHPGQPPRRRKRLRRQSARARSAAREWAAVTKIAIEAVGGVCQIQVPDVCTYWATEMHHRLPRSQGGPHTRANGLPGCNSCHFFVTTHPAWAVAHGFSLRRGGAE